MHSSFDFFFAMRFILCGLLIIAVGIESAMWHKFPHIGGNPEKETTDLNTRLPNHTVPLNYEIVLDTTYNEDTASFFGHVSVDLKVLEDTPFIVLHACDLKIYTAVTINGTRIVDGLIFEYDRPRCLLTLGSSSGKSFNKDVPMKVHIMYEGSYHTDRGIVLLKYQDIDGKDRRLAFSRFEPTYARYAFPCYDEPNKRATFKLTLRHSPEVKAISNTPMDEENSTLIETAFQRTDKISPHMLGFFLSQFKYMEGNLYDIKQRAYSNNGEQFPLIHAFKMTKRIAGYFYSPFILPKLDHIVLPTSIDKAELGILTYSQEEVLLTKSTANTEAWTNLFLRIAHGISHQYFGGYVSVKWWSYIWLTEGFATLFSYMGVEMLFPHWDIWQYFHIEVYNRALLIDASDNARPLTYNVEENEEINALYDNVTYLKGASVLNMWKHALTKELFQESILKYFRVNQFNATSEEDLLAAIQSVVDKRKFYLAVPIADMFATWTQQGGYPLITVTRNYEDGCFTVSQEAFTTNTKTNFKKLWFIPFNYVFQSKPDFRDTKATHYLLNETSVQICENIPQNDWLILNKQSTGYYRINYDERNWKLITEELRSNPYKIHTLNRAQLLNDAFHLWKANHIDDMIHRSMLIYIRQEAEYAPLSTFKEILQYYRYKANSDEDFTNFMQYITRPIYEKLRVNESPTDMHADRLKRPIVIHVACMFKMPQCLQDTRAKLQESLVHNAPIEVNLQSQVYCFGMKEAAHQMRYQR
ncbi:aminopeptidase N [Stomoxys calcitrans]|uniref:aminopeptidase N n=1 Tax=Stomoxys calcitrans TaxID=35570 RepID=UPI0027E24E15|nr:aminopeptidase N [Stomoxys calcitrans]